MRTAIEKSKYLKSFLELAQPLSVVYGYSRGIKTGNAFVTYNIMGTPTLIRGIGSQIVSERTTFIVTVQTATAQGNMEISDMIKLASNMTDLQIISEDMRQDLTVENRWINTIIFYIFNSIDTGKGIYTAEEARQILQEIADRYIYVTSIYRSTVASSFIDTLIVPDLPNEFYTILELIALKQEWMDRLLLKSTKY